MDKGKCSRGQFHGSAVPVVENGMAQLTFRLAQEPQAGQCQIDRDKVPAARSVPKGEMERPASLGALALGRLSAAQDALWGRVVRTRGHTFLEASPARKKFRP
jgi:hypothetical protein